MSLCVDERLVRIPEGRPRSDKYQVSHWTNVWYAYQTVVHTEWHIPGIALIQLILLMMGTWLAETCRE